jgi:hypothetical protein
MKKIILLVMFVSLSLTSYSEIDYTSKEYRDSVIKARNEFFDKEAQKRKDADAVINDRIIKNADTTKCHIDTCVQTGKEIVVLLKKEVKTIGLKKTIQINKNIFLPFIVFLILYLVWLKNRKK